jgi:CheY-like chemotaxis protein
MPRCRSERLASLTSALDPEGSDRAPKAHDPSPSRREEGETAWDPPRDLLHPPIPADVLLRAAATPCLPIVTVNDTSKFKILHIDDDPTFLRLVSDSVRQLRPDWAIIGHKADRRWLDRWPYLVGDEISDYDVIILDYQLDGQQAESLIRTLRATYDNCPPITILSGTLTPEREHSCLESGAVCCAEKPYSAHALEDLLRFFESEASQAPKRWSPPEEKRR